MNSKRIILSTLVMSMIALLVLNGCTTNVDTAVNSTPLVGTWHVLVSESAGGLTGFEAYHTFHADGTMTEVSSLLPTLTESPAHGAWVSSDSDYDATFELFAFNEEGELDIRIRVRMTIVLDGPDHFTGKADVDLLLPDGTIERDIDSAAVEGTRVKVEGAG